MEEEGLGKWLRPGLTGGIVGLEVFKTKRIGSYLILIKSLTN